MEKPSRYVAVFDASVLVPGFLANFLLWLAQTDLFQARWSPDIHAEWIRNRKKRYDIEVAASESRRNVMDARFPEALVTDYESLIDSLSIDAKDRHVLAAAVKCGANAIVTTNLKHFPDSELSKYNELQFIRTISCSIRSGLQQAAPASSLRQLSLIKRACANRAHFGNSISKSCRSREWVCRTRMPKYRARTSDF